MHFKKNIFVLIAGSLLIFSLGFSSRFSPFLTKIFSARIFEHAQQALSDFFKPFRDISSGEENSARAASRPGSEDLFGNTTRFDSGTALAGNRAGRNGQRQNPNPIQDKDRRDPALNTEKDSSEEDAQPDNFFRELSTAELEEDFYTYLDPLWSQGPYHWQIVSGDIPDGMFLDSVNGFYGGKPQEGGVWSFKVKITDALGDAIYIRCRQTIVVFLPEASSGELTIALCPEPSGFVGGDYFSQMAAQGGSLPYRWNVHSLCPGLNFERNFGMVTGVPLKACDAPLFVSVTDHQSKQASRSCPLEINTSSLYITTPGQCPEGTAGEAYSCRMTAQGGVPSYTWQMISGVLPKGLTFNPATAKIFGTPRQEQTEVFRIQVTDQNKDTDAVDVRITIVPAEPLITIQSLPEGTVGANYYGVVQARGGALPYRWALLSGRPPANIAFQDQGDLGAVLTGVPIQGFDETLTFQVTDGEGKTDTKFLRLFIEEAAPTITNPSGSTIPGEVGRYLSVIFNAQGGIPWDQPPYYTWRIISGSLPSDLHFTEDGILSGVPQRLFQENITVEVTDSVGKKRVKAYTLDIKEEDLQITTESPLPCAEKDQHYSMQLEAKGGQPPYTWSVAPGGSLPADFVLNIQGLISGIPKAADLFHLDFEVRDALDHLDIQRLDLPEIEPVQIREGQTPPGGEVGDQYEFRIEAKGAEVPYTWSMISGGLPQGLFLGVNDGGISGVPEEAGVFFIEVQVSAKQYGCPTLDTETFSIEIIGEEPSPPLKITDANCEDGKEGEEYTCPLEAEGGEIPYIWDIAEGRLPDGLSLKTLPTYRGEISGIPEKGGEWNFTVRVRDAKENQDTAETRIKIISSGSEIEPIHDFLARGSDRKIGFAWTNPTSEEFDHTEIYCRESGFPENPGEGDLIYSGTKNNTVGQDMRNEIPYYCSAFAIDKKGQNPQLAEDSRASATPHEVTLHGPYQPYADEVVSFDPLDPLNCFGKRDMPGVVLGSPMGMMHVVSLHANTRDDPAPHGGTIILKFNDNIVFNGSGFDFTVFENAFTTYFFGDLGIFQEPARVAVSQNGRDFYYFSIDFVPHYEGEELNLYHPLTYAKGFAGTKPVYSFNGSPDPRVPTDWSKPLPNGSGGDSFDLDDISSDITWIQYIKIEAVGDNVVKDRNGDFVRHIKDPGATSGTHNSGFDLDAVCAVNY